MSIPVESRKKLLNAAQEGIPLKSRPYLELGREVDLGEQVVMDILNDAYASGLIRETSAIFDARMLGYSSTLAAMKVAPAHLDTSAAAVSRHTGVSHNYARDHEYNLWFTLAVPPGVKLEDELESLSRQAGGWSWRMFPTIRTYKIGVRFNFLSNSAAVSSIPGQQKPPEPILLEQHMIACIRALQTDLPREVRPFRRIAGYQGLEERELLECARRLQRCGAMRRLAVVVRHKKAGYEGNIMSAWDVEESQMEQAASELCALEAVSHCYQRPTYPDWPFGLFAMFHSHTETECIKTIQEAALKVKARKYTLLKSVKEYKKERVRYFEDL